MILKPAIVYGYSFDDTGWGNADYYFFKTGVERDNHMRNHADYESIPAAFNTFSHIRYVGEDGKYYRQPDEIEIITQCKHGEGLTDYCILCRRINGG